MKALRFERHGIPQEVIDFVEVEEPGDPGPGEVLVGMVAMGINPADLLRIEGRYGAEPMPLPAITGSDGAGRVLAVGEGVTDIAEGDLVMPLAGPTYVERMRVPASALVRLPPGIDPLQAAMLKVNPATARLMLSAIVPLAPGDWVIQNAANSAVGLLVARFARRRGIRSVNIVRRLEAGRAVSEAGGDVVLLHDGPGPERLAADVARATGGAPVSLALDAVAGAATNAFAHVLAKGGVIANYGLLSGRPCEIDAAQLIFRNISLRGFWLADWFATASRAEVRALFAELAEETASGAIESPVEAVYPLSEGRAAVAHAARGGRSGKVLLTTQDDLVRR